MTKSLHQLLFFTLLTSFAGLLSAAPVTLTASDDNYVYTGATTTNYNSENAKFTVKNATSNDRIGYVKFDLSSVIASLDTSQAATLNLTFSDMGNATSNDDDETFVISVLSNIGASNYDWQEGGINGVTYNTRPTGTFDALSPNYVWSYNDSDAPYTVTVPNLDDYLQADNTVTFQIFGPKLNDTGNNPYWHSSEATTEAFRPSLTVVPEASTLGLMAVGMLAVIGISRRRKVAA
ncbi:DNRLRE domain-containing protein [Kiritimatiellaeota bacterium B1221]|nr:DNRLRE domain-containing protein [Kiritimatiellaeota bacterium B1221]